MNLNDAFTIVVDLAQENMLDKLDAQQDPEVLMPMYDEQQEAVERVTTFLRDYTVSTTKWVKL